MPNSDAICTSDLGPLSSFSYSQRCEVYLPSQDLMTVTSYQGTILSNPLVIVTPATSGISTSTYSIQSSETSGLVVVSGIPVVALVYKPEDRKGGHNSTTLPDEDSASMSLKPSLLAVALGLLFAACAATGSL